MMPRQIITIEIEYEECVSECMGEPANWDIEQALDDFYSGTLSDVGVMCSTTRTVTLLQSSPPRREDRDDTHVEECSYLQEEHDE